MPLGTRRAGRRIEGAGGARRPRVAMGLDAGAEDAAPARRRAPVRAAGAATDVPAAGINAADAAAALTARQLGSMAMPGPDPSMIRSVGVASELLLAVAERRATMYSNFEEAFKECVRTGAHSTD